MKKSFCVVVLVSLICLVFVACTKDSNNKSAEEGTSSGSGPSHQTTTQCGIPVNNELSRKPSSDFLITATIDEVISAELYILTPFEGGEEFLLKLPAVADNDTSSAQRDYIYSMIRQSGAFVNVYKAQKDCVVTVPGGGRAFVGSIVFGDGTVLAEKLLKIDFLKTEEPICANSEILSCYNSLKGTGVGAEESDDVVSNFLWKPAADKDGKLVVLLNPANVSIIVNGEKLLNDGPSNGRGSTARGKKSGCQYGHNVNVKVLEYTGKVVKFPNGERSYTIADGCKRGEFK